MAQADQVVQDAPFPSVRADINDNLAALFSQSSGNSAPSVTVAFQPWIDTSSSPAVWKIRNAANNGWITIGVIDADTFSMGGVTPISRGGTGQTSAAAALAALLPSQTGNNGRALITNGAAAFWGSVAGGASIQVFASQGTSIYTPTPGRSSFLVLATGAGGGGSFPQAPTIFGGAGGTAIRLYSSAEMGASAVVAVAPPSSSGANGGASSFTPAGTGLAITGLGGSFSGLGGGTVNGLFDVRGGNGGSQQGISFWAGGRGAGGAGGTLVVPQAGLVVVLEL